MSRGGYRMLGYLEGPGAATPDGDGGWVETWQPLDPPTWWCRIDGPAARNRERVIEGTTVASAPYLLRGDFHAQLAIGCRIIVPDPETTSGQRRFDVVSVQRDGERRFTLLVGCSELQDPSDPRPA